MVQSKSSYLFCHPPLAGDILAIFSTLNSLICHLYHAAEAGAERCGVGEQGRELEELLFAGGRRDTHGEQRNTDGERVKWRRCAPQPSSSLSTTGQGIGSLLTGLSNHPQIAAEEQEVRLTDTH